MANESEHLSTAVSRMASDTLAAQHQQSTCISMTSVCSHKFIPTLKERIVEDTSAKTAYLPLQGGTASSYMHNLKSQCRSFD